MKLLLTSAGLTNQTIVKALDELVGKPLDQLKIAFIPTAANLEEGDKGWLIDDLRRLSFLKFKEIDIVDISALPKEIWLKRLKKTNILFVEGGNTYHLIHWFNKSGLSKVLPELLKTKIYIGVSAGTMVVTPSVLNAKSEKPPVLDFDKEIKDEGLSLVNFMIEPHINSVWFPESNFVNLEKRSKEYKYPIYGIDDNTAIKIDGNTVEIASEGKWKLFKK
ncbi:MAG TPA: Type 1 glutamine amidotransferase-like domain-containing protein [Candidatus Woesebacteria bacterium]|jgi:dipeptidase E|nr:Type 1 glutamine amidotransferase-like domain-containing protein [Candidatus Shapirobacteria bacterium]HOR02077.1 Type 1 glutamine amidotransferase-like domain-containing protein [Candidatus Woesebacteria bacterium]